MIISSIVVPNISAVLMFDLGLIVLMGLIMGRVAEKFKIPDVTGYLIAGLILGPIFHIISIESLHLLEFIPQIALGFIAFQVGNELWR